MCGDVPITREKIRCLQPLPWLGSEVIDAYLSMLSMDPSRSSARILIMNSRLFTQLTGGGKRGNGRYDYSRVARWTARAQIGGAILEDFDKVMIPVNLHDTHWALCVVNCTSSPPAIEYYDSMGENNAQFVKSSVFRWLIDDVNHKSGTPVDAPEWANWACVTMPFPLQSNDTDCGVFMLCGITDMCRGYSMFTFSQADMPANRRRIAFTILNGWRAHAHLVNHPNSPSSSHSSVCFDYHNPFGLEVGAWSKFDVDVCNLDTMDYDYGLDDEGNTAAKRQRQEQPGNQQPTAHCAQAGDSGPPYRKPRGPAPKKYKGTENEASARWTEMSRRENRWFCFLLFCGGFTCFLAGSFQSHLKKVGLQPYTRNASG
jgi:hypothetical protein